MEATSRLTTEFDGLTTKQILKKAATALITAITKEDKAALRAHLDAKILNIDTQHRFDGGTALHTAAAKNKWRWAVALLIKAGANIEIKNEVRGVKRGMDSGGWVTF